jgi:hypothetical protein
MLLFAINPILSGIKSLLNWDAYQVYRCRTTMEAITRFLGTRVPCWGQIAFTPHANLRGDKAINLVFLVPSMCLTHHHHHLITTRYFGERLFRDRISGSIPVCLIHLKINKSGGLPGVIRILRLVSKWYNNIHWFTPMLSSSAASLQQSGRHRGQLTTTEHILEPLQV